ncbi:MAG: NCS2 family nucleobase:cation symporter [Micrococcales bacterium]|nr:NCS2 family nucleobase:cation symporter [Micrococcales bacterium]
MTLWKLYGDGRTIKPGEVVTPDQRLAWPRSIAMGMQHVVAMAGATLTVPALTGFPATTTMFFSGIGTIFFLLITGNRLPSYLGSSFAFLAPIWAVQNSGGGMGQALFGVMLAGVLLAIVGAVVQVAGSGWINAFMPPLVQGAVVMLIGFNLAKAAWDANGGGGGFQSGPLSGTITVVVAVLVAVVFKGLLGRLSILLGLAAGYIAALIQGEVATDKIGDAAWIGLPTFHAPKVDWSVAAMFIPVVLVLIAENVGHVKSVATMTGTNFDHAMGKALLADGLATTLAGLGGGSGTTTYAENIGVMAATKIYSTAVYWIAAFTALLLSLLPKFGAAVGAIPGGVLGGAGLVLYGMIGLLGARIWIEGKVNFANPVNLFPAAVALILGIANASFTIGTNVQLTGIVVGTIAVFLLYHPMRWIAKLRGTDS